MTDGAARTRCVWIARVGIDWALEHQASGVEAGLKLPWTITALVAADEAAPASLDSEAGRAHQLVRAAGDLPGHDSAGQRVIRKATTNG